MAKKFTTTATTEYTKAFVKHFESLRYNYEPFSIFSDFLALAALDISNALVPTEDRKQEHQRIVNKYKADDLKTFSEMFTCIVNEMQPAAGEVPRYRDVLGELFGGLNLYDSWKGQFFTPQDVSDFMALVTVGDFGARISKRGYIKMNEPCIGGGSTVIGAVNAMFQKGFNPCKQLLVVGYDLDPRCVHMSYVQLSLMGIPAMIQQRNTLTLETYGDYWYTPVFVLDDWAGRLRLEKMVQAMMSLFEENPTTEKKAVAEIANPVEVPAKSVQLSLF